MSRYKKIFEFLKKYQGKIALTLGFILVALISFAAGRLTLTLKSQPIEIKDEVNSIQDAAKGELASNLAGIESEGEYIGDINSNKFYPAGSDAAREISDENKIWFDSITEAEEQGYTQGVSKNDKTEKVGEDEDVSSDKNSTSSGKYVGSKNSNKYHLPDSAAAKRIKEENKVWFKSKEDAEAKGYEPGSSVKKEDETDSDEN
jgi:hypothetical protein